MYARVEKQKENTSQAGRQESRAVANSVAQKNSKVKQGFGFVDNRPEALAQRKLKETVTNRVMSKTEGNIQLLQRNDDKQQRDLRRTNRTLVDHVIQCVFNQTALDNFDAAQRILTEAENNYIAIDNALDGNRVNWGFSNSTWNTLRSNITIKSNHIRGQGVADALESLSWQVNDNPRSVRGPGGGTGIDLRLFSSGGIGGARMDIEVKHANTLDSLRDQINAAVVAHGRNQTITLYKNPAVAVPNINAVFVRTPRNYTFRGLGYAGNEDSARVEFYNDDDPTKIVGTRVISWN